MPFYTIDWTRYVNHSDIRGTADASMTINDLIRIALKIWKYSGAWFGYKIPKKFRWARRCHKLFLLLLTLCAFVTTAVSLRHWRPLNMDTKTVQTVTLTLVQFQCACCAITLFYWQIKKRLKAFAKLLNSATMGVGLIRAKHILRRLQYFSLAFYAFVAILISLYHSFGIYTPSKWIYIPYPWKSIFWLNELQVLSLLIVVYSAYNWFMAHVILANYYAFVVAELHSLNTDVRADSNLYQVAVLRHYTLIYHRLTHLNRHANTTFGPLLTVTAISNYVIVVLHSVLFIFLYDRLELADILFGTVSMALATSYLITFIVLALKLRNKGKYFFEAVHDIVAVDWNLDSEYHPVAACNAIFNKPIPFGLSFGKSWIVTGRSLAKVIITTAVIVLILYYSGSGQAITSGTSSRRPT